MEGVEDSSDGFSPPYMSPAALSSPPPLPLSGFRMSQNWAS